MTPELIRKQIRPGEGVGTEFKVNARDLNRPGF